MGFGFAEQVEAMEAAAAARGLATTLEYVYGTFLGLVGPSGHCPMNATARDLLEELRPMGAALCAASSFDFHVTPSFRLTSPTTLSEVLARWAAETDCDVGLVVFESNLCAAGERFDAALQRAAAFNALVANQQLRAAASSQFLTASGHFDGCGEGHVDARPDGLTPQPSYHALRLSYASVLDRVALTDRVANLSSSASVSRDSKRLALRVVNPDNVSLALAPTFRGDPHVFNACNATVTFLTSPLAADADAYGDQHGGWNPPDDPNFISPSPPLDVACAASTVGEVALGPVPIPPLAVAVVSVTRA